MEQEGSMNQMVEIKREMNCFVRELKQEETEKALRLAWKVFQEYEAPDYTEEGVEEFYQSIQDENFLSRLFWYGAFVQEEGNQDEWTIQ